MLELGDIDLAESLEIQKRRGVRMLELLDQGSQVKESESPFSSKNMEGSQNLRVNVWHVVFFIFVGLRNVLVAGLQWLLI